MKLRFKVDQAESFRRGIDCPTSIVTIEVNPAELSQEQRNLIADRMDGINVCPLFITDEGKVERDWLRGEDGPFNARTPFMASEPTLDALIEAVLKNQKEVEAEQSKNRKVTATN